MTLPPLPKDPRHQRFADLVLRGRPLVDAYLEAGFRCTRRAANASAPRLLSKRDVASYIDAIKTAAAERDKEDSILSVLEKRRFLARIVRTPLAALRPGDPDDPNGDLIKSHTLSEGETSRSERIEKLDPLKALEIDNTLSGDDGQKDMQALLTTALATLAVRSPLPDAPMPLE